MIKSAGPGRYSSTVAQQLPDPSTLDFLTFVDYAADKTKTEMADIDPIAMRLVLELHRVTSALVYDLESSVHRPSGWTWPGFRVLFVLWLAGPCEAKTVATLSGMSRSAVSALIKTLHRDGLVTRTPSSVDGRAIDIALSDHGREMLVATYADHHRREQAWVGALTRPERLVLIGLLEKLASGPAARDAVKRT